MSVARELRIGEDVLRSWERTGVLPVYGSVPPESYRDQAGAIVAARARGLSLQRIRRNVSTVVPAPLGGQNRRP